MAMMLPRRKTLHERNAKLFGFTPHQYTYGQETRTCSRCGDREAYWDDEDYPINPCFGPRP